ETDHFIKLFEPAPCIIALRWVYDSLQSISHLPSPLYDTQSPSWGLRTLTPIFYRFGLALRSNYLPIMATRFAVCFPLSMVKLAEHGRHPCETSNRMPGRVVPFPAMSVA